MGAMMGSGGGNCGQQCSKKTQDNYIKYIRKTEKNKARAK